MPRYYFASLPKFTAHKKVEPFKNSTKNALKVYVHKNYFPKKILEYVLIVWVQVKF